MRRLARLVLVVAQASSADRVDAATVERAWREPVPAEPRAADRDGDRDGTADRPADRGDVADADVPPSPPRVRVVRRLWE